MEPEEAANLERERARAAFRARMRRLLNAPRDEVLGFAADWRPVTDAIRDRHEGTEEREPATPGIANL